MIKCVCEYANEAYKAINNGAVYEQIINLPSRSMIGKMKYVPEDELDKIENIITAIKTDFLNLERKEEK